MAWTSWEAMRLRSVLYAVVLHLREYKILYLVLAFLLIVGIACGARTAAGLDIGRSLQWGDALGGTLSSEQGGAFLRAAFRELRFFLLLAVCGIGLVGVPAAGFLVALRGFLLGFTFGFLIGHYGAGGLWIALLAVLPQNLLILSALLFSAAVAMRAAMTRTWGKPYWVRMGLAMGVALLGASAEALLSLLLPAVVAL